MDHPALKTGGDGSLLAIIGDEDTVTGFLLAGIGNVDLRKKSNFLVVTERTPARRIEEAFNEFTTRDDIAIVLIAQSIANQIRSTVVKFDKAMPAVLEIPSKDHPYNPNQDGILQRVKGMFGGDLSAAT